MKQTPFSKEKIARFFESSLSETEHAEVLLWFSSLTKDDQLEFMEQHFAAIEIGKNHHQPATGFSQLEERILRKKQQKKEAGYWVLKIAAATLPFIAGYLLFTHPAALKKVSPALNAAVQVKTVHINNLLNTTEEIQLPDASIVSLYPGAVLDYPEGLNGKKREITLSGKAFFKVKHDERRPFTVKTGAITTVVLGTSFWVDAAKNARTISVKVKTGKVGVIYGTAPAIFLLPSEKAIFNTLSGLLAKVKQPVIKQPVPARTDVPAALVFNETPLKQVIQALSENLKIRITLQDGVNTDLPVSLNTKNKTIAEIMQQIKLQIPIDYEITDNAVTIKKQE